jgi:hypothetical protein
LLTISNINHELDKAKPTYFNFHLATNKIMEIIVDLIEHEKYKWERIFVFYQEPERIEHLVSLTNIDDLKFHFEFRLLDHNHLDSWIETIKIAKEMSFYHFIVDLDAKYINFFFKMVSFF